MRNFTVAYVLAAFFCLESWSTPPDLKQSEVDQQITKILTRFDEAFNTEDEATAKASAIKAVEGLDISTLNGVQLGRFMDYTAMIQYAGIEQQIEARLETFLDAPGADGATAAVHFFGRRLKKLDELQSKIALYKSTFGHEGLDAAISADAVNHVLATARPRSPELLKEVLPDLLALDRFIVPECGTQLAHSFDWYFGTLNEAKDLGLPVELQPIRRKMVAVAKGALGHHRHPSSDDYLRGVIGYLEGAWAREELIGHPSPEIPFLWSSDSSLKSMDDLKGRVLLLEFWATWCGPCVGAIPKTLTLREHYHGHAVEIIGLTEHCGWHYPPEGEPINTHGSLEREHELMSEFIAQKQITWPIVFTEKAVQGEFGVRGIPYMVAIDSRGIVRHDKLDPRQPLAELAAKIDAMLVEAGQPTPPPPTPAPTTQPFRE